MKNHLTLKEKDQIVKKIYKNYQRAELDILFLNQHYNYYPQIDLFKLKEGSSSYQRSDQKILNQMEKKMELEAFCQILETIHKNISRDTFFFIEHEYLNFYDALWWEDYYSRASYYRIKHKALDEFLEYVQAYWSEEELLMMMK